MKTDITCALLGLLLILGPVWLAAWAWPQSEAYRFPLLVTVMVLVGLGAALAGWGAAGIALWIERR